MEDEDVSSNLNHSDHAMQVVTTSSQPVDNAISQMEELTNSLMQTDEFTEDLQESFQQLSNSLVELESDRLRLHDELEITTINASIIRHALKTRPAQYQEEMEAAVLAARNGNASTIESLQSQMKIATDETKQTLLRQQGLQKENAKLMPEREAVTRQHDEIIAALNQRMADKASRQIKLNETCDQLRETTSGVKEYDLGMQNLEDDMAAFNAEANAEQSRLETEIVVTQDAIEKQNQKNADEKRMTDQVLDKIMDMTGRLDVVLKDVRRTENSKTRLEMQSIQLEETINREKLLNQQTAEEVSNLKAARDRQKLIYAEKIQELEKKIFQVEVEHREVEEKHRDLSKKKDEAFLRKEEMSRRKSKAQASAREKGREVQEIRKRTTLSVEKAAQLSQANTQFEDQLVTLNENHLATKETFNQQIIEYESNLDAETTEKRKAQDEQEQTEKSLDNFKAEQIRFMNDMTKKIEESRTQHKQLSRQSLHYNQNIAKNIKRAGELKVELDLAEKGLEIMIKELTMEIERLKTSIEICRTENIKKAQHIEEKKPILADLEQELKEVGHQYGVLKNEVVAVRNRQKSVQEQINRTQVLLNKLEKPNLKFKADIKSCLSSQMEFLSESAQEMRVQELEIYTRTQKLESILEEKERFEIYCSQNEMSIDEMLKDIKCHGSHLTSLFQKLQELQLNFSKAWDVCTSMEVESAEQDAHILKDIEALQNDTKDRCLVLTGISEQLCSEMSVLTGFLENVNSRRPKDTRQEKRRSLKPIPPPTKPNSVKRHRRGSTPFSSQPRKSVTLPPSTPVRQTVTAR